MSEPTVDTRSPFGPDDEAPVFVISVAADLAGMHAQTLRQYDRLGLVTPSRTRGGGRRYSHRDVQRLREVQRLSQEEGISLAGIQRILDLENQVAALQAKVTELRRRVETTTVGGRTFAVSATGEIVQLRPGRVAPSTASQALVRWQPRAHR